MMLLTRLMVIVVLGLWGSALALPTPVRAADPTWTRIEVGLGNGLVVSDDGTSCHYPTNFPIKAGSDVKLVVAPHAEPVVDTLNNLIAETYLAGDRSPGDACAIWARFDHVPMRMLYVIELSAVATTDATDGAPYTEAMTVLLLFWTREFETSIGPDGAAACEPTAPTAMRPSGSFQSDPSGEPVRHPPIVGEVRGEECLVSLFLSVPPSHKITVAIGNA